MTRIGRVIAWVCYYLQFVIGHHAAVRLCLFSAKLNMDLRDRQKK